MCTCDNCREKQSLATCQVCGSWVCPAHRWSTGRPSDGYYCVDSWCAPVHKGVFSIPPWAQDDLGQEAEPAAEPLPAMAVTTPLVWRKRIPVGGFIGASILLMAAVFLARAWGWL